MRGRSSWFKRSGTTALKTTERARLEAELRRLTAIIDHAADAIVTKDRHGVITEWNRGAERLYGYRRDEAIGQPITLIIPEERQGEDRELLARALAGETISQHETLRRHRDGTLLDVSLTVSPLNNEHGEPDGAAVITREITEQKLLERQLAGLFENTPASIALRGLDGRYLRVNGQAARLYGKPAAELVGTDPAVIYPDSATRERVRAEDAEIRRTGEAQTNVYELQREDGSLGEFQLIRYPVRDAAGRVNGFGSFAVDITEQRALERQARASAEHLRSVLDNAPIGMALIAPEGRWLEVNRALCEIVGYSEDELSELTFQAITHPDDLEADLVYVHRLLAGEISDCRFEKRYIHKAGHEVWVQLSVTLGRDETGEPLYFIAQIQDVTREREAREALAESERRYKSIASNVPGMVYRYRRDANGEGSLPFASAGARDLYGLEPEQLMADPSLLLERIHPEDQPLVEASIVESATHFSRWDWHCRHITDNGEIKFLRATAQPAVEPDGSTVWDGVIMDETPVYAAQEAEIRNRQRLQAILENLAGSAVTIFDADLCLQMCEGPLFAHRDRSQIMGQPLSATATETTLRTVLPAMQRALAGESASVVTEADQDGRALSVRVAPYREVDGKIVGVFVHWHDISEVREAQRDRDQAMDRFRIAFERAPIGMAVVGSNGGFQRVNQAFCELTGHSAEELLSLAPFALVLGDHLAEAKAAFAGLGLTDDSITLEYRIAHASGEPRWVQARWTMVRDQFGHPLHALAQILDITERREREDRLQHLADHDPLSGLLNRRGFETMLASHLARCQRYEPRGALLMLDLDGFKRVNDALGHARGDVLLVDCAHALKTRLRESDVIARLGGDEFAVLLPEQDHVGAVAVARALIDGLRARTAGVIDDETGPVTVSIGIVGFSDEALDSDEMLARADLAMYEAKQAGKDRYALFGRRPVAS